MAQLRDTATRRSFPLRAHHRVGRCAERSDTVVSNPITSRVHLLLEWDGERWTARDLSKNGTWLDDYRLPADEPVALSPGDRLALGAPNAPPLELVDDTPPRSWLISRNNSTPELPLEPFVFLPAQYNPEAVLAYSRQRQCWLLHTLAQDNGQTGERVIYHGDILRFGDHEWQVFQADTGLATGIATVAPGSFDDIEFVFELGQGESATTLRLNYGGLELDLGPRTHHVPLLHLARLRAVHAAQGLGQNLQGWIDNEQLKEALGMEMARINTLIFRARQQIAESLANSLDAENLVERCGKSMRFGGSRLRIYDAGRLTGSLPPKELPAKR